jgi:NAD(P)-dependent dehydrogenase (short-subunit alcohol dehydrogenase family)
MPTWTTDDIPSLAGRLAVVTGGSEGLGYEDARALARAGASVIIAARNPERGHAAAQRIRGETGNPAVRFDVLDLASLQSIADFSAALLETGTPVDILINNAGIMTPPERRTTTDGFELQFGLNYLGHFALTARLLPLLQQSGMARVVSLGSVAARNGRIDFDDLQSERYAAGRAYAQSKLADLLFAFELHRRSTAAGWGITSIAAHPGVSRTNLLISGAGAHSISGRARRYMAFMFQPADRGALPTLFAATSPEARGGAYYGPRHLGETRGPVHEARVPAAARDEAVARRLWEESERLTGLSFAPVAPARS